MDFLKSLQCRRDVYVKEGVKGLMLRRYDEAIEDVTRADELVKFGVSNKDEKALRRAKKFLKRAKKKINLFHDLRIALVRRVIEDLDG